ncbi:unnamed protein product [Toxocara canis]|uniref:Glycosyltransferase family 92 protein n=1 Tax=Toxocara canis TaxID=6265 RepID=A0A183VAH1_TOXCA|nr:unnamed protein product [Toxocara canis]
MNAYLITDDTIRMTIITKCDYYPNLTISIGQHTSALLKLEPVEPCESRWDAIRSCTYAGYIGSTTLPKEALGEAIRGKATMFISYVNESHSRNGLRPIDSRASSGRQPPHRLAVCVAPIAQFSSWPLLARFFEWIGHLQFYEFAQMWIAHGATKFYLPVQSITPEVDAMLRIYENDPKISIERMQWGLLPSSKSTSDEENPNNQLLRSELTLAINDCVLRARGRAEYVSLLDLDEIIVIRNNLTLLQNLDSAIIDDRNVAVFIFRSSFGTFDVRYPLDLIAFFLYLGKCPSYSTPGLSVCTRERSECISGCFLVTKEVDGSYPP